MRSGLPARPRRHPVVFWTAVVTLLAVYVALALYFVRFGRVNEDEGWYLYAARLVYEGMHLYRDFPFFQAPLLPYLYGVPQKLFGGGLMIGRFTSFFLSLITVFLGFRLSLNRGGRLAGVIYITGIILTPLTMWTFTTTRTEPMSATLLMVTAFFLMRERPTFSGGQNESHYAAVRRATRG